MTTEIYTHVAIKKVKTVLQTRIRGRDYIQS